MYIQTNRPLRLKKFLHDLVGIGNMTNCDCFDGLCGARVQYMIDTLADASCWMLVLNTSVS